MTEKNCLYIGHVDVDEGRLLWEVESSIQQYLHRHNSNGHQQLHISCYTLRLNRTTANDPDPQTVPMIAQKKTMDTYITLLYVH